MSKAARQADISFDPEDPRCNDGGPACEGCLMVGWCLGDYPPAAAPVAAVTACSNCHTCAPNKIGGPMRMIVCLECGNKRCPHATDHRNACTGSNESGQPGSAYPAVPTLDEVRATLGAYEAAQEAWRSLPPFVQCLPCAEFDADATCPQCPGRADHCEDIHHMVPCAVCAVGHATLQRDDAGYYRACEACGGCADSGCQGRGER